MSGSPRLHQLLAGLALLACAATLRAADQPGILSAQLIYEDAPFPQCHASTIVETPRGLVAAWFGGTHEGHRDVGIWISRHESGRWSAPVEVVNGIQYVDGDGNEHRYPCWNPVLWQQPGGPLVLFYKCGPSPGAWWGMMTTSDDGGRTWAQPHRLPERILGPVRSKPILLPDGALLCPTSDESDGWRVHFELTRDLGKTWTRIGPINDGRTFSAIQPTLLTYPDGRIQAINRTRQGVLAETWTTDGGRTWTELEAMKLPNPNAGADGVTLADGRQLLVYNHTVRGGQSPKDREMLNVAVSDDGKTWHAALVLEKSEGEYSYPAVIQSNDGLVHITYTWRRERIKHVVVDPTKLELREMVGGRWE